MKILKRILLGLLILATSVALGLVLWANIATAEPIDAALQALESDEKVTVTQLEGMITFAPAGESPVTGFIFYPGGLVDYRAYAPELNMIADHGYFVVVVDMPLNLAYFDVDAANDVISKYPEITLWAIGGHSLGGVSASSYASTHLDRIKGLAFWASYPSDDSLKNATLDVVSIYGTLDGLATLEDIEASKTLLPPQTVYVPIEGGNHAQFGAYGPQDGDNPASISPEEQWVQVVNATVAFLENLSK
jgi:pimeloyl-ACP methyl ester carboxylesterase